MEKPSNAPDPQPGNRPLKMWRPEEDRPSKGFQWMVNLPDKFTARKFNLYQLFLVATIGALFYFFVLQRLGD